MAQTDQDSICDDPSSPPASHLPRSPAHSPSHSHQSGEPSISAPTTSTSKKRRRDAQQGHMLPPAKRRTPRTTASSATSFPSSVRQRIHNQPDSNRCWNCGASPVDMCHVIGKKEPEIAQLERDGFLPPDFLPSFENSITLCPLCHRNFDDLNCPGFIFLPDDLGYFISAAKADLQERQRVLDEEDRVQRRRIPSQEDYHLHCATKAGIASESLDGGYYKRYALRDYYQSGVMLAYGANPYKDKKTWPGSPFAAIRRAFYVLAIKAKSLPPDIKAHLRQLSDLYDEEPKPRSTSREAKTTSAPSTSGTGVEEDGHEAEEDGHEAEGDGHDSRPDGPDGPPMNEGDADLGNRDEDNHDAIPAVTPSPHRYPPGTTTDPTDPTTHTLPPFQPPLNRLSQASTLVDAAIKFDRLPTFKRGPNDHVVRIHDYDCRHRLLPDHACRACVIEKYDSLGIMYEPTIDDWPTTCEASDMYPGVLPLEEPPRWQYGPMATAQEQVEKKMRSRCQAKSRHA